MGRNNEIIPFDITSIGNSVIKWGMESISNGTIMVPEGYGVPNAVRAMVLKIIETKNKDGIPALNACTKESVYFCLQDMIRQGLNPGKNQCYPVVFGEKLLLMRSYFGTQSALGFIRPDIQIPPYCDVVYDGDEFEFETLIKWNKATGEYEISKVVTKHVSKLDNINNANIVAAFCVLTTHDGKLVSSTVMTIDEIKDAWGMSRTKPVNKDGQIKDDSTHARFPQEMAKKTCINRACKALINTSNDEMLFAAQAFNRTTANEYLRNVTPNASVSPDTEETPQVTQRGAKGLRQRLGIDGEKPNVDVVADGTAGKTKEPVPLQSKPDQESLSRAEDVPQESDTDEDGMDVMELNDMEDPNYDTMF